jgi:hypothetical protein
MLKKVTLLIPLTFNDGTAVTRETLDAIEEEIYFAFNGWTVAGEVQGAYRMRQTGKKQVERLLQVWVVVEEAQLDQLRHMVARYASLLAQESMYFEVAASQVEFIVPLSEKDHTHGHPDQSGGTTTPGGGAGPVR